MLRDGCDTSVIWRLIACAAIMVGVYLYPLPANATDSVDWLAPTPQSTIIVDHASWDSLLNAYVHTSDDGINRVDYEQIAGSGSQQLGNYLTALTSTVPGQLNRDEQLAYWLNLYNALTVRLVSDHYPVASIREIKISGGLFRRGPWKKNLVTVDGHDLSLNNIEHDIVRHIWNEPNVHYGFNCAALGCPNLIRNAFTGANVKRMLADAARAFINHPRGVKATGHRLKLSKIYDWYDEDFGGSDRQIFAHLRRFADADLVRILDGAPKIVGYEYDWTLNDVR